MCFCVCFSKKPELYLHRQGLLCCSVVCMLWTPSSSPAPGLLPCTVTHRSYFTPVQEQLEWEVSWRGLLPLSRSGKCQQQSLDFSEMYMCNSGRVGNSSCSKIQTTNSAHDEDMLWIFGQNLTSVLALSTILAPFWQAFRQQVLVKS